MQTLERSVSVAAQVSSDQARRQAVIRRLRANHAVLMELGVAQAPLSESKMEERPLEALLKVEATQHRMLQQNNRTPAT